MTSVVFDSTCWKAVVTLVSDPNGSSASLMEATVTGGKDTDRSVIHFLEATLTLVLVSVAKDRILENKELTEVLYRRLMLYGAY